MLLPYDTALSYWMMAVPIYEWQPEAASQDASSSVPPAGTQSPLNEALAPTAEVATPGCAEDDDANAETGLPQLRLVQVGVRWVAIPYWTPRDNPFWNLMADAARDDDRQRLEAKRDEDRQRALPGGEASDPLAVRQPE